MAVSITLFICSLYRFKIDFVISLTSDSSSSKNDAIASVEKYLLSIYPNLNDMTKASFDDKFVINSLNVGVFINSSILI